MPDASFAGQQETFLNVKGCEAVLVAVHVLRRYLTTALFISRSPRYDHKGVALSAGIQHMVRSDIASSGVIFTIDTGLALKTLYLLPTHLV